MINYSAVFEAYLEYRTYFLWSKLENMPTTQKKLVSRYRRLKEEEIWEPRATVRQSDRNTELLEQQTGDLEQYSCINDVIITVLEMKQCSYARAAAGVWWRHTRGRSSILNLHSEHFSACHTLLSKDNNTEQAVVVQSANKKRKVEVLQSSKKLKGN